jgi:atypical dual specificity phosphatase
MSKVRPEKRAPSIAKYAVGKRSCRSSDGRHGEPQRRHQRDSLVVFSPLNPEEEDTVLEAQWRLLEALKREHSLSYRAAKWWRSLFQISATSARGLATVMLDHVLLGSDDNAANREQLLSAGVTHICNCATQTQNHFEGEFVYLQLHLHDAVDEQISPHFQVVARFLHRVERLRGRALIHCVAGVSRSATLLVAYLMLHKGMTLLEAYYFVRRRRPCVQPNQAFRLQLATFEVLY